MFYLNIYISKHHLQSYINLQYTLYTYNYCNSITFVTMKSITIVLLMALSSTLMKNITTKYLLVDLDQTEVRSKLLLD